MMFMRFSATAGVRRLAYCAALGIAVVGSGSTAGAQTASTVLLVSQAAKGVPAGKFVDLAPHLQPALQQTGRYNVVIYHSSDSAVQNAVKAGQLNAAEIISPLSKEAAHNVAKALSIGAVLYVSANTTPNGVNMSAELELLAGQNVWGQSYLDGVTATKQGGKKFSLLENIHSIVDRIVQRMTNTAISPTPTVQPQDTDIRKLLDTPIPGSKKVTAPTNDKSADVPAKTVDTATQTKNMVLPVKKDNFSTYELVIDHAKRTGDLASLIMALRKAINERPRDVRLRRDLASAYKDRGWVDLAKEESESATMLAPDDGATHRLKGEILSDSGDSAGALREFKEAARLSPNDASCRMSLGDALMADGHADDAIKEFQAAVQLDPKSPAPHLRMARLDVRRASYTNALTALATAKSLAPNGDTGSFSSDCGAILTVVESTLTETLPRLQQARVGFNNGTKTREEAFKEVTALRKRADDLSNFLDGMPDVGFARPQALYGQACSLAVQAADKLLEYLETQSTSASDECNLLRLEANKQIGEAAKRMKTALDGKGNRG